MRTWYSDDQEAIAEVFAAFFANESSIETVRAAASLGFDRKLWEKLIATGALGMALPASVGGGDGTLMELAVVVGQWGRHLAPVPLVEHAITARLLAAAGAGSELIADLVTGNKVATLTARSAIEEQARLVPAGAVADVVVAIVDDALIVAESQPPGASRPNTADLPIADRDLSGGSVLASGPAALEAWRRALAEWKALTAVAYSGLTQRALEIGVAFVKQRHQFGVPVGSFQAVQHGLADAATRSEGARLLAHRAVWALVEGRSDGPRLASMALLFGAETARFSSDRVLQYHGGYGYSEEYDIQLYYRRAAGWLLQFGAPAAELADLAVTELGPVEAA